MSALGGSGRAAPKAKSPGLTRSSPFTPQPHDKELRSWLPFAWSLEGGAHATAGIHRGDGGNGGDGFCAAGLRRDERSADRRKAARHFPSRPTTRATDAKRWLSAVQVIF